jgi:ArsR family transcriptional regulator, arsenate/arsenite/antimonite-responsive transcriptional repressor
VRLFLVALLSCTKIRSALAIFSYFLYYRNMEEKEAIKAFGALAQEHRLKVFRLLVRHAPHGLPAGYIAAQVGVPASTMSTHLAQLERAGLLRSWREQRRILYAVDTEGIRQVVTFLTEECCGGRPELCGYDTTADACQGQDTACGRLLTPGGAP